MDCTVTETKEKNKLERGISQFVRVLKSRNSLLIPKSFIEENDVREGDFLFFVRKNGRLCVRVYHGGGGVGDDSWRWSD